MKFYLVFAAVLLSSASAKVMTMPEKEKVPDSAVSIPIEATVVEIPKDHMMPMPAQKDHIHPMPVPVPEVNKVPTTVAVDMVKVPLSQSPQVPPQTVVDVKKSEKLMEPTKEPVVEMPKVPKITQLSPVPVAVLPPEMPTVVVKDAPAMTSDNPSRCDILCTKFELNPICGVSADCIHEFPNQCTMDTFNCLHPEKAFKTVRDERCKMHWLNHCTEKYMEM